MTTINDFAHREIKNPADLQRAIKLDAVIGTKIAECDVAEHNRAIENHKRQIEDDAVNLAKQLENKIIVEVEPTDDGIILYLRDNENNFYCLSTCGTLSKIYFNNEQDPNWTPF